MKASESPRHLGQSISMAILLIVMSLGVTALMLVESGALK